ncbi:M12 family metallopeptidase [Spirosoma soli]|uniref:M12 family metallopeptidase n=1 Tax=Spirosoma soli TaxID=1770529 RepID=A0ABW5MB73_9BACT
MKTNYYTTLCCLSMIGLLSCSPEQTEKVTPVVAPVVQSSQTEEAFPNQLGTLQKAYLNRQAINYRLINGEAVFERDILLSPDDLEQRIDIQTEGTGRTRASSRWPNKIVYYALDPALPNQARVLDAIAHWEANTPIRFVQRTTQRGYVLFRKGTGCSSNIGYSGGLQYVNLADGCTTGNTIHEIGHTIGLWHEHSRADRDTYVTVNKANIVAGAESDFQTYAERGLDGFDYSGGLDFQSIMMYGSYSFSANGQPTLTRKDGSTFVGQRSGLSPTDALTVSYMYP